MSKRRFPAEASNGPQTGAGAPSDRPLPRGELRRAVVDDGRGCKLNSFLLLVAMPGATSSVLAP